MIIKNDVECLRAKQGMFGVLVVNNAGGCHCGLTVDKPLIASKSWCSYGLLFKDKYDWVDPFCTRLFPEIVGTGLCPCSVLSREEIIERCRFAFDQYEESKGE